VKSCLVIKLRSSSFMAIERLVAEGGGCSRGFFDEEYYPDLEVWVKGHSR